MVLFRTLLLVRLGFRSQPLEFPADIGTSPGIVHPLRIALGDGLDNAPHLAVDVR